MLKLVFMYLANYRLNYLLLIFLLWWLESNFLLNWKQNTENIYLLDHLVKQNIIITSHGDLKSKFFFPNFQSSNDQLLILKFSKDHLNNIIGNFEDE
jgi:hypothetical protein